MAYCRTWESTAEKREENRHAPLTWPFSSLKLSGKVHVNSDSEKWFPWNCPYSAKCSCTQFRPPYWVILPLEQHHVRVLIYFTHENIGTKRCDILCSRSQTYQLAQPRFTSKLSLKPIFLGTVNSYAYSKCRYTHTHNILLWNCILVKKLGRKINDKWE